MRFKGTGIQLGTHGARDLAAALAANEHVATVLIGDNGIGDKGAAALADMLRTNRSITALDLSHNGIQDLGGEKLVAALATAPAGPSW